MKVRQKILGLGLGIATASVVSVSLGYGLLLARVIERQARESLAIKLDLVDNRVFSAYDQLSRAGLQANPFYRDIALGSIETYSARLAGPGEIILAIGEARRPALSSRPSDQTPELGPDDALRALGAAEPGVVALKSQALGPGRHIVAYRSFEPWGLLLVVAVNSKVLLAPLGAALGLSLAVSALILGAAYALSFYMSAKLAEPIAELSAAAAAIGGGDFSVRTAIRSGDELGALGRGFNDMAGRLQALTGGLESEVRKRTDELSAANERLGELNRELRVSLENAERMQDQLVQAEKLSALGVLTAGIAHELNTPLGANAMAAELLDAFVKERLPALIGRAAALPPRALEDAMACCIGRGEEAPRRQPGRAADRAARKALEERIASAGAPDAHLWAERALVMGLGEAVIEPTYLGPSGPTPLLSTLWDLCELKSMAELLMESGRKAAMVVQALQSYVRPAEDEGFGPVDLDADLDTVFTLLHSKLKGLHIRRERSGLKVRGVSHQLSQVWMNIINNAAQAMDYAGALSIHISRASDGFVALEFEDEGSGIPPEIAGKIFEPFFTTKKLGQGLGLGLDICKKIIDRHGGSISFESAPGRTVFRVRLPAA
jgi:signal transduction histidine kinase